MTQTSDSRIERVKQKVRALLNLANDSAATAGEVAAAMNMANKLMREYMLSIKDVEVAKKEFECISKRVKWLHKQRVTVSMDARICEAFNCQLVFNSRLKLNTIYGVELDVDTAIYMVELAHNALNKALEKYKRSYEYAKSKNLLLMSPNVLKNDFVKGFAYSVMHTCMEIIETNNPSEPEETNPSEENKTINALVVVKNQLVDDYVNKTNPNIRSVKSKVRGYTDSAAFGQGTIEGRKVRFNKGITTNAK